MFRGIRSLLLILCGLACLIFFGFYGPKDGSADVATMYVVQVFGVFSSLVGIAVGLFGLFRSRR
jgi:hypothetical protein